MRRILSGNRIWVTVAGLFTLALVLRSIGLGEWAFHWDEPATLVEQAQFFGAEIVDEWNPENSIVRQLSDRQSQFNRLPRIVPLGYFPTYLGTAFWGHTEFGTRAFVALMGSLIVPISFLILRRGAHPDIALPFALLLAIWPRHIYFSQLARFYLPCSFFTFLAILLAYRYATDRAPKAAHLWWSVLLVLCAIACHTVAAWLIVGLPLLIVAARGVGRDELERIKRVLLAYGCGLLVFAASYLFYLQPLLDGWNGYWGPRSILGVALSLVRRYDASIMVLGLLGVCVSVLGRKLPHDRFMLGGCVLFAGACLIHLATLPFHTVYMFPASIFVLLAAACGLTVIAQRQNLSRIHRAGWITVVMIPLLLSLASHYQDGSRQNIRAAMSYVAENWSPGDRMEGMELYSLVYPNCCPEEAGTGMGDDPTGETWKIIQTGGPFFLDDPIEELQSEGWALRFSYLQPRYDVVRYGVHVFSRPES